MELSGGTWEVGGQNYYTNKFYYEFDDATLVEAYRCPTSTTVCSSWPNNYSYSISIHTPFDGADWESDKNCWVKDDIGYKICKSLEGQGFETRDER